MIELRLRLAGWQYLKTSRQVSESL